MPDAARNCWLAPRGGISAVLYEPSSAYERVFNTAWNYAERITSTKGTNMTSHGHFHWNELMTANSERARKFYQETIGWRFESMTMDDGATYWVAYDGATPVAGIFPTDRMGYKAVPEGWMPYLAVDDVDTRAKKAVDAGAQLMRPIFDIPNIGRIAILTEPGGAGVGWITPVMN